LGKGPNIPSSERKLTTEEPTCLRPKRNPIRREKRSSRAAQLGTEALRGKGKECRAMTWIGKGKKGEASRARKCKQRESRQAPWESQLGKK